VQSTSENDKFLNNAIQFQNCNPWRFLQLGVQRCTIGGANARLRYYWRRKPLLTAL